MGSLKNDANGQAGDKMHADKSQDDNPRSERYHDQWKYQSITVVQDLPSDKFEQFVSILVFSTKETFILIPGQSYKVLGGHPGKGGQAIKEPDIIMLKLMYPIFFGMRGK